MTILVLGGNFATLRVLEAVGEPTVVVSVGRSSQPPREVPDARQWRITVDDLTSVESIVLGLRRLPPDVTIDSVYTQDEFALITAGALACALGVSGPDIGVSAMFRDKTLQKATLRAAGVPVADWREIEGDADEMIAACDAVGYPVVIKPVAGAATKHTALARDRAAAESVITRHRATHPTLRMVAERFVEGPERNVNGIIVDGEIVAFGVERYLRNVLLTVQHGDFVGAVVEDPQRRPDLYERVYAFTRQALGALGLRTGVFHMEAFETRDGLVYGECAARPAGAYVNPAFERKFGIDLPVEALRLHLLGPGRYPAPTSSRRHGGVAWASLRCPPGRIESTLSTEELLSLPGVVGGGVYVRPGDPAPDLFKNSAQRAGHVLVEADDEQTVEARIRAVCEHFLAECRVAPAQAEAAPR